MSELVAWLQGLVKIHLSFHVSVRSFWFKTHWRLECAVVSDTKQATLSYICTMCNNHRLALCLFPTDCVLGHSTPHPPTLPDTSSTRCTEKPANLPLPPIYPPPPGGDRLGPPRSYRQHLRDRPRLHWRSPLRLLHRWLYHRQLAVPSERDCPSERGFGGGGGVSHPPAPVSAGRRTRALYHRWGEVADAG